MSLTAIRPYFKARGEAVGLKYNSDVFNNENIPSNILDKSFGVSFNNVRGQKLNQQDQEMSVAVEITLFIKGYRSIVDGLDRAVLLSENLVKEVEKPSNRLGTSIKNVSLSSIDFSPVESNDNIVTAKILFNVFLSIGL